MNLDLTSVEFQNSGGETAIPNRQYRRLLLLESRDWWDPKGLEFDAQEDLVLTYDLALRREVERLGGTSRYLDHLCDRNAMQADNFLLYRFFREWHNDADGRDILRYKDVEFGISFRLEFWNDLTAYVRARLCIERIRQVRFTSAFVGISNTAVLDAMADAGFTYQPIQRTKEAGRTATYYFPAHQWMDEKLRTRKLRHRVRDVAIVLQSIAVSGWDAVADLIRPRKRIFVQEYHPTREIIRHLQRTDGVRVVLANFTAERSLAQLWRGRPIPISGNRPTHDALATAMLDDFAGRRAARLVLASGLDITAPVYRLIERRLRPALPKALAALESILRYVERHPLALEVLIANLGQIAPLVDCVAKHHNVPSYLIINGLMGPEYLDEAKYATVINSYSHSIREHYFRGMNNIICLGDPRMDQYAHAPSRTLNRTNPTIAVGTSGFNSVDLNSYVAVEFEFIEQVLTALASLKRHGKAFRVVIKVRSNGYARQYEQFADEYFPGLVDRIVADVPMRSVLNETDFYISIQSQTLFEASCLGIPCVYHKNSPEFMFPPFDGNCELVTTTDVASLECALLDFWSESPRFDSFLDRQVMEKYIGYLDGRNLERNLAQIHAMLNSKTVLRNI